MSDLRTYAKETSVSRATNDTWVALRSLRDGSPIMVPWLTALAIEGKLFQVRAATITTPLTGDVEITDTAAEACADAATNTTILPVRLNFTIEALGGTLPQITAKSVGAVSTAGTAFVPLPLKIGGSAATSTARVSAAGGVTVAAELATTTRRHVTETRAVAADGNVRGDWSVAPPVLVGPACFYVQVGSVTTGSTYFGEFDYAEFATSDIS